MRTLTAKAPFKSSLMRLNVCQPGLLNAVVYWHDVDGVDGFAHNARIVHLDRTVRVEAASKVSVIGGCAGGGARTFKLRGNVVRTIFSSYSEGIISSYRVLHRSNFTPSRHDDAMITGHARALPPWEVTWGGGASVENPHYQRVHYCELILREFLGVVERGRTDIWKDVSVVLRYVVDC